MNKQSSFPIRYAAVAAAVLFTASSLSLQAIPVLYSGEVELGDSWKSQTIREDGTFGGIDYAIFKIEARILSGGDTFESPGFANVTGGWVATSPNPLYAYISGSPTAGQIDFRFYFAENAASAVTLDYRVYGDGQWVGWGTVYLKSNGYFDKYVDKTAQIPVPDGGSSLLLLGICLAGIARMRLWHRQ